MSFPVTNKSQQLIIEAPAKINLYLAVKSRRADGYHEIESLMQKVRLSDQLQISIGDKGIRLACPGADLPVDERNLAYRAALVFFDATGLSHGSDAAGVDIVLNKKIPVAAGLGGGSSNAAAVLKGLNALFNNRLENAKLLSMAATLGADVPFFVSDYDAAWASGIGERLSKAETLGDLHIVLVNPGFPLSTHWAYENFTLTTKGNPYILAPDKKPPGATEKQSKFSQQFHLPAKLFNDLEKVSINRFPEIGQIKQEMQSHGADGVLMSGSGPTVFGLFANKEKAISYFEKFVSKYVGNIFLTRPCRP